MKYQYRGYTIKEIIIDGRTWFRVSHTGAKFPNRRELESYVKSLPERNF